MVVENAADLMFLVRRIERLTLDVVTLEDEISAMRATLQRIEESLSRPIRDVSLDDSKTRGPASAPPMGRLLTGSQLRMARAALKMGIREVASATGIAPTTILRVESDLPAFHNTIAKIRAAFEVAGLEFLDSGAHGPGVRLRSPPSPLLSESPARRGRGRKPPINKQGGV